MEELIIIPVVVLGVPWIVLHYITKWKTAASLTNEDEHLLEELYVMSKRLDERMDTIERIVKADNPGWQPDRLTSSLREPDSKLKELDKMLAERNIK